MEMMESQEQTWASLCCVPGPALLGSAGSPCAAPRMWQRLEVGMPGLSEMWILDYRDYF